MASEITQEAATVASMIQFLNSVLSKHFYVNVSWLADDFLYLKQDFSKF